MNHSHIVANRNELITEPHVRQVEALFDSLFAVSENTILKSGAVEPLYMPAGNTVNNTQYNVIFSTKDYFSSALHEISHWCIAGRERRQLVDYGYWYEPDGRSSQQQALFERVEVKPQALEWLFSLACGLNFRLSVDNVNQPELTASDTFRHNVYAQAMTYLDKGLPERAALFINALLMKYRPEHPRLSHDWFKLADLK